MAMTNRQVYQEVVELTQALAKTGIPNRLFRYVHQGNLKVVNTILNVFKDFSPELSQRIVTFGKEYNEFVGNSEEINGEREELIENGGKLMYSLVWTGELSQLADAIEVEDDKMILTLLKTFKMRKSVLADEICKYRKDFAKYKESLRINPDNGAIFGTVADVENGVYIFDTSVIDALAFYTLSILANIAEIHFFRCDDEALDSAIPFFKAIERATNVSFAKFVKYNNAVDCFKKCSHYQTVGEVLINAYNGGFNV